MSRRTKIIIVVVIGVVLLLIVVLLALAPRRLIRPVTNQPAATGGSPAPSPAVALPPAAPVTKEPRTQSTLEAVAITFAERYGSYSSERQPDYLATLSPLMTERFAARVKLALPAGTEFYGISTKALSAQIIALTETETEAQVVVQTQRTEARGGSAAAPTYQKITLTLVKAGLGWQVDRADWQ